MRVLKIAAVAILILIAAAAAAVGYLRPAVAAYVCPFCYSLESLDDKLFVEATMPEGARTQLKHAVRAAEDRVRGFYGSFATRPTLLVCATTACDRRLGGIATKAQAYGYSFMQVSSAGASVEIVAHEFSHLELHARVGPENLLRGALPAWFDEGVAVIVGGDPRYVDPKAVGLDQCLMEPRDPLPSDRREWAPRAGRQYDLYAQAACKVLHWMDARDGFASVLAAADQIRAGGNPIE